MTFRPGRARRLAFLVAICAVTAAPSVAVAIDEAQLPRFVDTIEQRMQACVVCHGKGGGGIVGSAFPRLAGQPADYLAAQMKAFRDGTRTYAPMNFLMSRQSDRYFAEIAGYFSAQPPDPKVVQARQRVAADPMALAAGSALVRDGRPEANLPACNACHGAALGGMLSAIPGLAGMPRDFLIEQVGSWKSGAHRSAEPNCMAEVARKMTGDDIAAAATWLSLQPADARPEKQSGPLPLACRTQ